MEPTTPELHSDTGYFSVSAALSDRGFSVSQKRAANQSSPPFLFGQNVAA
jgi:hypothetical protein